MAKKNETAVKETKKVAKEIVVYNKEDLIDAIVASKKCTRAEAGTSIDNFFEGIKELTPKMNVGDRIQLVGKATCEMKTRASRNGNNPRTKEDIVIPEKNVLAIKFGSEIANIVPQKADKKSDKKADAKKADAKTSKTATKDAKSTKTATKGKK